MKYFLFIDHPKGNLDIINQEKEERIRSYFNGVDTLKSKVDIMGKTYNAVIDYAMFANLTNFDCFNCVEHCCGDAPAKFTQKTREFILENQEEFNRLTKTMDILEEIGNDEEEIRDMILSEEVLIPKKNIGIDVDLCPCAYTPKNGQTLCSLHSICLDKDLGVDEIIDTKPLICSIWPLEIILEEETNTLYITLPDDFTNNFTIENFYTKSCINIEYAMSPIFRRENPDGFLEDDYDYFIETYSSTLKKVLGNENYDLIKNKLIEEEMIESSLESLKKEQINRNLN